MIERTESANIIRPVSEINVSSENHKSSIAKKEQDEKDYGKNKLSADELKDNLTDNIDDLNSIVETLDENLSFKLHEDTKRLMVQVVDIKSGEVIKEMPPEEMLDLAAKIHKLVGLLIDEKV